MTNKKFFDLRRAEAITGNEVVPLTTETTNTVADLNFISAWFNAKPTAYNFGALADDPAVSPFDGGPIPLGAQYYNTTLNAIRAFGDGGWFTPNLDAAIFALATGAQLVGTPEGTVQEALDGRPTTDALAAVNGASLSGFVQDVTDAVGRTVEEKLRESVSIFDMGVIAGAAANAAANTAAFQRAFDNAIVVRVPFIDDVVKVTSGIGVKNGRRLVFDSEYMNQPLLANPQRGVVGDGSGPVFTTSIYPGGSNTNREIRFDRARIWNTGYPCLSLLTSDDAKLSDCAMHSSNSDSLRLRFSARVSIRGGSYRSSFSVLDENNFAITAYDNCNGLTITPDTIISGGSNGGGVDTTQTQKASIDGIFEINGTWGVRVGGYSGTGAGNCNAIKIAGYFEQCRRLMSIGANNLVLGPEIGNLYGGNTALPANGVLAPDYTIELGRVSGLTLSGGSSFHKKGTEPTFKFVQPSSGGTYTDYLVNSTIENFHTQGGGADYINLLTLPDTIGFVFGRNRIKLSQNGPASGAVREYISPLITANVGKTTAAYILNTGNGGVIDGIEVIDATGTLASTIRIGYSVTDGDNVVVDPSTLTIANGAASLTLASPLIRPNVIQTIRVIAGAGTGTYRIRIRYRM